ncbi:MAG: hypothetical protein WCF93_05740 [Candidatus Moraniibacteriota bacterium]
MKSDRNYFKHISWKMTVSQGAVFGFKKAIFGLIHMDDLTVILGKC